MAAIAAGGAVMDGAKMKGVSARWEESLLYCAAHLI